MYYSISSLHLTKKNVAAVKSLRDKIREETNDVYKEPFDAPVWFKKTYLVTFKDIWLSALSDERWNKKNGVKPWYCGSKTEHKIFCRECRRRFATPFDPKQVFPKLTRPYTTEDWWRNIFSQVEKEFPRHLSPEHCDPDFRGKFNFNAFIDFFSTMFDFDHRRLVFWLIPKSMLIELLYDSIMAMFRIKRKRQSYWHQSACGKLIVTLFPIFFKRGTMKGDWVYAPKNRRETCPLNYYARD